MSKRDTAEQELRDEVDYGPARDDAPFGLDSDFEPDDLNDSDDWHWEPHQEGA